MLCCNKSNKRTGEGIMVISRWRKIVEDVRIPPSGYNLKVNEHESGGSRSVDDRL